MIPVGFLRAKHQLLDGARGAAIAGEHFSHLRRDRQLDAVLSAERERRRRRLHPFGHHLHAGDDFGNRPAVRQLDADVPIAAERPCAGQDEVAEPAQAGERLAAPADRARQPRDFGEAACNQRREGVLSKTEPFDDACGNGNDVFQRAADFDADDIGAARTAGNTRRETPAGRLRREPDRRTPPTPQSAGPARPRSQSSAPRAPRPAARPGPPAR